MATLMTTQGLQRVGVQTSQATAGSGPTYSASRQIQTMSVDNNSFSRSFAAGDVAVSSDGTTGGTAPTSYFDKAFDASPTRASQTISHVMTLATGEGNFAIVRIALHDDTAANTSGTSGTFCAGIDGLSLTKNSTFTLKTTFQITYS